jgi:hypothetical protein
VEVETEVEKCFEEGRRDRGADGLPEDGGLEEEVEVFEASWLMLAVDGFEFARKRDWE